MFELESWGPLLAVIVAVIVLGIALFAGGRPSDVGRARWQVWVIGGLVMLALLFFLSRSLSTLSYETCRGSSFDAC